MRKPRYQPTKERRIIRNGKLKKGSYATMLQYQTQYNEKYPIFAIVIGPDD